MAILLLQILFIVLVPWLAIRLLKGRAAGEWISPVVIAYASGIIVANLSPFPVHTQLSTTISEATVVLAIPLLLYATDIVGWWKKAGGSILSFFLCIIAGIFSSVLMAFVWQDQFENSWQISGMLVGVYTGGTPNMQAVGMALGADENLYVLLNAADIFCGGIYLLFLTSIAHSLLGRFLPNYKGPQPAIENKDSHTSLPNDQIDLKSILKATGLTLFIIGLSAGLTFLLTGGLSHIGWLILLLSALSITASLFPAVRQIPGTFIMGEYLLLMFCVAVGLLSDFQSLWSDGGSIIAYMASVMSLTIVLHFLLARWFRIDRDTVLITSTAALYGPVFIGQVASAIRNRALILPGMATGLVGIALGNFLGYAVGEGLRYWLGG
ncbi:MAG: DUF819 family protein [Bacteroidota bacterium]